MKKETMFEMARIIKALEDIDFDNINLENLEEDKSETDDKK